LRWGRPASRSVRPALNRPARGVLVLQCSFSVCLRNRDESYKAVERYVDEWRAKKQTPFRCYYDTISLDTVIVEKMYTTADVVHRSAALRLFHIGTLDGACIVCSAHNTVFGSKR